MRQLYFSLILFFLLVFEGIAFELLPNNLVVGDLFIIPHWIFVFLFLMAVFYENNTNAYSIIFGIIFGLLIDIVYTGILGVYMFAYPVTLYIISNLKNLFHANFIVTLFLGIIGITIVDSIIHLVYIAVGIINIGWSNYLIYRLLPTLVGNLIFLIAMYPIVKNRFIKWKSEQLDQGTAF
ncbi:rod shape-determining protein MreD [Virgibacillus sp. W0430]|uniref:rod shape-determining protein MreD n=1 Tax=Virgibacillus sp. W0430 TaxID=3391580 RepID=UPI003F45F9AF